MPKWRFLRLKNALYHLNFQKYSPFLSAANWPFCNTVQGGGTEGVFVRVPVHVDQTQAQPYVHATVHVELNIFKILRGRVLHKSTWLWGGVTKSPH